MKNGKTLRLVLGLAAICAFTLGLAATSSAKQSCTEPCAITKSGVVLGATVNDVNEFLGIPYAKPPVGALRWEPPEAFGKFETPFEATAFGSECTQPGPFGSEDCLFLNVYTPAQSKAGNDFVQAKPDTKSSSTMPVMVW